MGKHIKHRTKQACYNDSSDDALFNFLQTVSKVGIVSPRQVQAVGLTI